VTSFDFNLYLSNRRAAIDRALDRYLQGHQGHGHTIWKAMRYGLFPGGKRIRPILTLASGELFGARPKLLMPFACALEMIHAYSIIHDDLPAIDNDDLRRGEPTAHKVFGEGMALLAGDGLLTEAFRTMAGPQVARSLPPVLILDLIHEVGHAVGLAGLVGGQAFDLEAENKTEIDLATVEYIHVRKTGALILTAVRIGARAAGAKGPELRRVSRYGEFLGLAFQIADDILDARGQTAPGERAESGRKERKKATYPAVVGVVQAKERLQELLQQSVKQLSLFGAKAEPLRAIAHFAADRALHEERHAKIQGRQP
jgi:geranylgeranyl diphosphate synthase, type II